MKRFSDKTALITGGGSGIGAEICKKLASEGANVAIVDIDEKAAKSVANEIIDNNGMATAYQCDIADNTSVANVIRLISQYSQIDILINNAGIAHVGNIENTTEDDLDRLYQINVKGVFNTIQAVIESMKRRGNGVILNMASIAASVGIADRFAYSMSKGAVLTMTYSVARDYVADGIRCNCISPGRVHTPFVDNFLATNYPDKQHEMFERLSKSQPIGRMGKAAEIAGLVAYLCSDEAAFITGSNFPIDGGFVTLNN